MTERASTRHWTYRRKPDEDLWHIDEIRTDKLHVEVYVSPTGRSQRVFVNGVEIKWNGKNDV